MDQDVDVDQIIRQRYFDEGSANYLDSSGRLRDFFEGAIPEEKIIDVISQDDVYSLHKQFKKGQRNVSYSNFWRYRFECDLIDVRHLAEYNDNVNYLFTCIDTFTRYAFVRLMESKHGSCAVEAFKSILEEAGTPPVILVMDRGSEFYNDEFKIFCERMGIRYYPPDSSTHAAYIERFNRTFQGIIYKFLTRHQTRRYISIKHRGEDFSTMPFFMTTYNNSHHRMIGTTPAIAEKYKSTHLEIMKKMSEYRSKIKKKQPKFAVGDTVRIQRLKGKFDRGYDEQTTEEIFRIYKIKRNMPIPMYILCDYDKTEKLKGAFYANELVKVNVRDKSFNIEKVLKKKRVGGVTKLFVKWRGWPERYNSWIDEGDVTQVF